MTEVIPQENSNDIISNITYEESNPVYKMIKQKFTDKLKQKYDCKDYDAIVNYVFDFVFKRKFEKSKCIEKLDPYFHHNATEILNYLWQITKDAEKEQNSENSHQNNNYKKGGKNYNTDRYRNYKQQKYQKGKRERSRSDSRRKGEKNYDNYDNYKNYPMQPKGFYPPKRFPTPMMGMGMAPGYPPRFFQPPMTHFNR